MELTRFLSSSTFALLLHSYCCMSTHAYHKKLRMRVSSAIKWTALSGPNIGPGSIREEWAACGNGKMQSPIDILDEKVVVLRTLGRLRRRYVPAPAILVNRGHDITSDRHHEEEKVGCLDPSHVNLGNGKYYRYMGSLTIPPCTEGVVWTLIEQVGTVSEEQLKLLRDAVHDDSENNARPTQATNERDVHLYQPSDKGIRNVTS